MRAERKRASDAIGARKKAGEDASAEMAATRELGERIKEVEVELAAVEAALRAIQRGAISYTTFCDRIAEAGCVGYFVSLKGKRALYYGRTNDVFVEWFPGARP